MTWLEQYQKRVVKVGAAVMAFVMVGNGLAHGAEWHPREGCAYTVEAGDTLGRIAAARGDVTAAEIAANTPLITDIDHIETGWKIDVCNPNVGHRTTLSQPAAFPVPDRAVAWAVAVLETAPAGAPQHHIDFLVSVSGPESQYCNPKWLWNAGDAGGLFTGSYGCIQVRTMADPPATGLDSVRNLGWLRESKKHQAIAAWTILYRNGSDRPDFAAWGPARYAEGIGVKLPADGDCSAAADPAVCRRYWRVGRAALVQARQVLALGAAGLVSG